MMDFHCIVCSIEGDVRHVKKIIGEVFLDDVTLIPATDHNSLIPWWEKIFMMCHKIGLPPISTIGFGLRWDSSDMRVPIPPARITAFICCAPRFLPKSRGDRIPLCQSPENGKDRHQVAEKLETSNFSGASRKPPQLV